MTRRRRLPLFFSGTSSLELSDWWKSVHGYFNQPVAAPRPQPVLPTSLIEQVSRDLDAAGASVQETAKRIRSGKKQCTTKHSQQQRDRRASSQDKKTIRNVCLTSNNVSHFSSQSPSAHVTSTSNEKRRDATFLTSRTSTSLSPNSASSLDSPEVHFSATPHVLNAREHVDCIIRKPVTEEWD